MTHLRSLVCSLLAPSLAIALVAGMLAPGRFAHAQELLLATAEMRDAQGKTVGTVTLEETPQGVLISAKLAGLPPGVHAFHIHEVGKCEPPFTSAGGHFNPLKKHHGVKSKKGSHAGDLPNLHVPPSGAIQVDVITKGITLRKGAKTSVFGPKGTAFIIHAAQDDYSTNPTGNAGGRIACGVIVPR